MNMFNQESSEPPTNVATHRALLHPFGYTHLVTSAWLVAPLNFGHREAALGASLTMQSIFKSLQYKTLAQTASELVSADLESLDAVPTKL